MKQPAELSAAVGGLKHLQNGRLCRFTGEGNISALSTTKTSVQGARVACVCLKTIKSL